MVWRISLFRNFSSNHDRCFFLSALRAKAPAIMPAVSKSCSIFMKNNRCVMWTPNREKMQAMVMDKARPQVRRADLEMRRVQGDLERNPG